MITIKLLNPLNSTPLQSWKFSSESVIRIGRSSDNEVTLGSSIVSRYHTELRRKNFIWELVNLSANGTYIENQLVESQLIRDNVVIRLSPSGPKLQIEFSAGALPSGEKIEPKKLSKEEQEKAKDTLTAYKA